jgi:hypothetical protein
MAVQLPACRHIERLLKDLHLFMVYMIGHVRDIPLRTAHPAAIP